MNVGEVAGPGGNLVAPGSVRPPFTWTSPPVHLRLHPQLVQASKVDSSTPTKCPYMPPEIDPSAWSASPMTTCYDLLRAWSRSPQFHLQCSGRHLSTVLGRSRHPEAPAHIPPSCPRSATVFRFNVSFWTCLRCRPRSGFTKTCESNTAYLAFPPQDFDSLVYTHEMACPTLLTKERAWRGQLRGNPLGAPPVIISAGLVPFEEIQHSTPNYLVWQLHNHFRSAVSCLCCLAVEVPGSCFSPQKTRFSL